MAKTSMAPQGPQDSESQRELRLTCMGNLLRATEERVYFKDLLSRFLFVSAGWIAAYAPGRAPECPAPGSHRASGRPRSRHGERGS